MTPIVLPLLLVSFLVVSAVGGPWLIRRSAPALMRVPRLSTGLLVTSLLLWLMALAALGPLLAWVVTGPALLPAAAGEICQRCLDAASPFSGAPLVQTGVPSVLLLAVPSLAFLTLLAIALWRTRSRARRAKRTCQSLMSGARRTEIAGYTVTLIPKASPLAFALPRRRCGIVLSTGVLDLLDEDELTAVLAHEEAHLRQRHHLITALIAALAHQLRAVPLMSAIAHAVPHYLEIAADNAARSQVSTPALAGALFKLADAAFPSTVPTGALHAAGPSRISHLTGVPAGRTGLPAVITLAVLLLMLGAIAALTHLPYAYAALTGCI